MDYIFTSEAVGEGHPDKVCDQLSDTILDAYLAIDPEQRVAVECLATTNLVVVAGEVKGRAILTNLEIQNLVRQKIADIGYAQAGFDWHQVEIINRIHAQSADIAMGVDAGAAKDEGAGDQGMMFGYACRETPQLMPAAIAYAQAIVKRLAELRHSGALPLLGPDAKSQVSLLYKNGVPVATDSIVVSTQHAAGVTQQQIRDMVIPVLHEILPEGWVCAPDKIYINPTGQFVIGGPDGDTGLTGRKIIVDTYGGAAPHGGGAFSGKDPTKVDRSAAYAARYVAKNIVAAGLADRCTMQISYAIGMSQPVSLMFDLHGTGKIDADRLVQIVPKLIDLSPRGIRTHLGLNKPIYARTAAYGHFGREPEADGGFSWERLDLVAGLQKALG